MDELTVDEILENYDKDDRRVARYCPNTDCKHLSSKVVDSRPVYNGAIRRTRLCPECGARWTTLEQTIHVIWSPGPLQFSGGKDDGNKTEQG